MKNSVRRLNYLALLVSILLTAAGCSDTNKKELRQRVEATARTCPIRYAEGVSIDTIEYKDDTVTYFTTVKSPLIRLDVLEEHKELILPALVQMVEQAQSPEIASDLELCSRAGAKIRFALSDGTSTLNLDIDPQEIIKKETEQQ